MGMEMEISVTPGLQSHHPKNVNFNGSEDNRANGD